MRTSQMICVTLMAVSLTSACTSSSQAVRPAPLGTTSSSTALQASITDPGPLIVEKLLAATWVVDRAGLINLEHPKAQEAGLSSGDEAIGIYFYRVTHPEFGTYLIDSGVARSFESPAGNTDVSWLVRQAMNTPALKLQVSTGDWLDNTQTRLDGVFLTHLHLDHIMGLTDVPMGVPVYTGPGETSVRSFQNAFTQGTTDRLLKNVDQLLEWQFSDDPDGQFAGVIDVFGDGSLWAIHVPGHTPGSTAFVARTANGPQLITGDASHTAWGWEHGVEPGEFSVDVAQSAESLTALKRFAVSVDELTVHPGHQQLDNQSVRLPLPPAQTANVITEL
jgi:N-acyl homoserine lactone hydrolase